MPLDRMVTAAVGAAMIAPGCGDDNSGAGPDPNELTLSELVGTWDATGLEAANRADLSEKVDLIELGGAATLKIESNRRIAFVATFESETEAATGSFTIGNGFLYIDGDAGQESMTLSCSLSGDTMTVANTAQTYDFDGNGIEEGARITMVLERSASGFTIADIVGTWNATRWEFTNDADPSEKVDVIERGVTATVTVQSDGRYALLITLEDGSTDPSAGVLQTVGEYLVARDDVDPEPEAFSCALAGDVMALTSTNTSYDFDEDGLDENASYTVRWERRVRPGMPGDE
jgi:hypothetical protein